jgi:5-methylcytosine-specific restriction protein B
LSRYNPHRNIGPIITAAEHWKTTAFLGGGSALGTGQVWTADNIAALEEFFVENPKSGKANFMSKLEEQLRPAPEGAKLLAAEMLWFMLLCPSNIAPKTKRETVLTAWAWSDTAPPSTEPWLTDEVLLGIGSGGVAYNTERWRELVFFIRLTRAFHELDHSRQKEVLADSSALSVWLEEIRGVDRRQFRHMLLYLLFPDESEPMFGGADRQRVLTAFDGVSARDVRKMSALDVSRSIAAIRRRV